MSSTMARHLRQGKGASNELSEEAILVQVENSDRCREPTGHVRCDQRHWHILHTNLGRALLRKQPSTR